MPRKKKDEPINKGFALWQLSNQWQRGINILLKEYDLTHVQYILLEGILKKGNVQEHLNQKELSDYANSNPMMTSKVLRTLEEKGFVGRIGSELDSRAKNIDITKQGKSLYKKVSKNVEEYDNQFFSGLGGKLSSFLNAVESLTESSQE